MGDNGFSVVVDRALCDSHGQCVFAAPEVFSFDDLGELLYEERASEASRGAVENAIRLCPVSAIAIDG
ncbi:ferredoxin [Mycobacterium sp. 852013-50091_SCH5140682]|uniref:ferredoxin n=1 Tax=Mycobacterium sp. 852013-50091_SCH5140682 TaxID=1834109 RepID=UPI0007E96C9F|nr:ferredoxin [Mycobacterium sp. 852013-50091_SCH5140682]OBC01772.1 ferredoxin [Mycobacterium sp. 852013-50091_SCH5140682]